MGALNFSKKIANDEDNGLGLIEHIYGHDLSEDLPINQTGNLTFHWGNWKESCDFQKSHLQSFVTGERAKKVKDLEALFGDLRDQPIWVNNTVKTVKLRLFDLYYSYLDPKIRKSWFGPNEGQFLVSLSSETGPYVTLQSMRWFDKEIYRKFIYHKILNDHASVRDFRLGLETPLNFYFDSKDSDPLFIYMGQITPRGLLLRLLGEQNFNRLLRTEKVFLEFDLSKFKGVDKQTNQKFKSFLKNEDFNLVGGRSKHLYQVAAEDLVRGSNGLALEHSLRSGEFYIFLDFSCFEGAKKAPELGPVFSSFLKKAEEVFREELYAIGA